MTWYAAHAISWTKKKTPEDEEIDQRGPCEVWEDVVLVNADDPDGAIEKASEHAKQAAAADSTDLVIDGQPGEVVFMGIRKLSSIPSLDKPGEQPDGVVEVTSSELEVRNYGEVLKLAHGDGVIVRYVE